MEGGKDTEHPGILYFYSESIALASNGICALIVALVNFGALYRGTSTGLWFLIIGGAVQLLCALRAYRAYDHFGATAFAFYSAFWALLGLEIIQSTSIYLLHIALVIVGVLLTVTSPIINRFYPILLASLNVTSSLELALRVVDDSRVIKVAAAISELCVVAITGYGSVAAVLHGVHERQVLPGLDDAVVETALLKRDALKGSYSDGKYANPAALGGISCSLGYAGLAFQYHGTSSDLMIWFATFAVLCGVVSLLHNLRRERIWAVSSVCDTCLFATMATISIEKETGGIIMLSFAAVRLFLLAFAILEECALMHILTFILQASSLLIIGVASCFFDSSPNATTVYLVAYLTSFSAIYNGVAELANSVAQKEMLPTGQDWKCKQRWSNTANVFMDASNHQIKIFLSLDSNIRSDLDTTIRSNINTSGNSGGFMAKLIRKRKAKWSTLLQEYANNAPDKVDEVVCPGDNKLMGKSDFQSPLFVMTIGTAIYSLLLSAGVSANLGGIVLDSALVLLVSQLISLLMCLSRGQSCYGFLCFTYLLEGMALMSSHYSGESESLVGIILPLRVMWLIASFHVFRLLSITTVAHSFGLLFYSISGISKDSPTLRYTSGVFFATTFLLNMLTLGILLGSAKSIICRWILQSSDAETEGLCKMGFASNREDFDLCVKILREGGVCCIPTDTVYCLACAANSPEAIQRIYAIKNRPSEKPLSLWLGSIDDIRKVSPEGEGWTPKLFAFMESMWPGSVSLVASRGEWLIRMGVGKAASLIGTEDSIALRVPNSTLTVALLKETGPLAITSANPSGACDCTHHNKVDDLIASKIDYILADGPSPMTIASSVIDVRNIDNNELFFYRVGCVPEANVWKKLNDLKEKSPSLLADVNRAKSSVIQSFMSQITSLVGCETYKIHMLINKQNIGHGMNATPWDDVGPRTKSAFVSGVSFYDDGEDQEEKGAAEMISPLLNSQGEVIAVLQLLVKISGPTQFKKEDLRYSALVSTLICDNLPTTRAEVSLDWSNVSVVTLTERGYGQKLTIESISLSQRILQQRRQSV